MKKITESFTGGSGERVNIFCNKKQNSGELKRDVEGFFHNIHYNKKFKSVKYTAIRNNKEA